MKYLQSSFTMPQLTVNPDVCCEACVFGRGQHSEWCEKGYSENYRLILDTVEQVFGIRLAPAVIPSDCQCGTVEECGEFDAVGYLPAPDGRAICINCLERGRHLSAAEPSGDTQDEAHA